MEGVVKRFRGRSVLDGVDLEVRAGELHVLIGENGAGKSTIIRLLATTLDPDAGVVRVAGHDVVESPRAVRAAVGLCLADERSWTFPLTGRQNLEFFACLYGLSRGAARARVVELLGEVGLDEAADRPFNEYSTGMRLRLSIARALIHRPPVLLLDEPTRSLDPTSTAEFEQVMRDLAATGRTLLVVTHDMEAASQGDAVSLLADGRVRGSWRPAPGRDVLLGAVGACDASELRR